MSPVQDRYFNDSVAGVDWRMRERAKQVHRTSVPRPAVGKSDALARVRLFKCFTSNASFSLKEQSRYPDIFESRDGGFILDKGVDSGTAEYCLKRSHSSLMSLLLRNRKLLTTFDGQTLLVKTV